MIRKAAAALLFTASVSSAQAPAANVLDRFPASEDRDAVTATCSACHTLARVAANNRDKTQWAQTVKAHDSRGLKLEPDETEVVVRYLSTYFGPKVFLNTATAEELSVLPRMDRKLADAVVSYRGEHGPFKNAEEVAVVIGTDAFSQSKNRLAVDAAK